MRKRNKIIF